MTKAKTGFDEFLEQQLQDKKFAAQYRSARAEIDAVDKLIIALDSARVLRGISKAELARKIQTRPELIRRLLTAKNSNPTMETVLKLATALGYHLELIPNVPPRAGKRSATRAVAARRIHGSQGRTSATLRGLLARYSLRSF